MKILVTGATGFAGSVVVERLLHDQRFAVVAATRSDRSNTAPGIRRVIVGNIDAETAWQPALAGVQAVVHLAARVHVMHDGAADPLTEFRRINVAGTLNLARQAAAAGVRRFLFISSIKVNGEGGPAGVRYSAEDRPTPVDAYGISKLEAENGLRELAAGKEMEIVTIRPPLMYGPNVRGNLLSLLSWVERGLPLPFANVHNRRSLLNVRNFADVAVRCIDHPAAAGETFLVSDGEDVSTGELIKHLAGAIGRKPRLFPVPLSLSRAMLKVVGRDDLYQRLFGSLQINTDSARRLLGWTPPMTVAEAMEEMGRWYLEFKASR